ncbi:MAG: 16S rRNA (guanine(966)-N(2))-methyltransferase RsmD [Alphaproteobacteria bacterium]|nr:16S rRNA (guanine(966)-N(2))-methyltransferase RsmD [Alphaproteobacteria bacterium]
MRITAGEFGGRVLHTPKDASVRPTSDKVRQAIFNVLASRGLPEQIVVADLFCGTGALGLEALSRGASHCLFVDKSRESLALCRKNVEALGLGADRVTLMQGDARKLPSLPESVRRADLVFLDPPYRKGLVEPALEALMDAGWVEKKFWAVVEIASDEPVPAIAGEIDADKTYGDTRVLLVKI